MRSKIPTLSYGKKGFHIHGLVWLITLALISPLLGWARAESYQEKSFNVAPETGNFCGTSNHGQPSIDVISHFVRNIADNTSSRAYYRPEEVKGDYDVRVSIWYQGKKHGQESAFDNLLYPALERATIQAVNNSGLEQAKLRDAWIVIDLLNSGCSILEYHGNGWELMEGMVMVRRFDKRVLRKVIVEAKEYLFRITDNALHGAHKIYNPVSGGLTNRLYTIYTSSLVSTLIHMSEIDPDPRIKRQVRLCAQYILSMQSKERPRDRNYGAFYYSYYLETKKRDPLFVVGTTSKTIFALLDLYKFTGNPRYLTSAELAADWLLTMQRSDGSMKSYLRRSSTGRWHATKRFSFLYNGQVLSALSRIYLATKNRKYLDAAQRIADYIRMRVPSDGSYMGDDYRRPNPISSSWALLSLYDFYEASGDKRFLTIVNSYGKALLSQQLQDVGDLYNFGRWKGSMTSSGNGWLGEVMSKIYLGCLNHYGDHCENYKDSVIKVTRWIMQYIYTTENMYRISNPKMARGGIFWSRKHLYVRTDSVCHGVNAFITLLNHLEDGDAIAIPGKPMFQ